MVCGGRWALLRGDRCVGLLPQSESRLIGFYVVRGNEGGPLAHAALWLLLQGPLVGTSEPEHPVGLDPEVLWCWTPRRRNPCARAGWTPTDAGSFLPCCAVGCYLWSGQVWRLLLAADVVPSAKWEQVTPLPGL